MSKIVWIVIAIVVVILVIALIGGSPKTNAPAPETGNLPAATAENSTPDAIFNSLTAPDSGTVTTPIEKDPSLTATDQQSLSDISQSFDPNQIPNQ